MPRFTIRFHEEDQRVTRIRSFAESHTDGNEAEAIRQLVGTGLDAVESASVIENAISAKLDEAIDRMAKVSSRGTKAALASLVLSSTYLPVIAEAVSESSRLLVTKARKDGVDLSAESVDAAMGPIAKHRGAVPSTAFDFAWDAGGRLQAQRGSADYRAATKGLRAGATTPDMLPFDLWEGIDR